MESKNTSEILLVGNELGANATLRGELLARAYRVTTACDGQEVLARATERDVTVVVSELSTPGMSGLELLGRLRSGKPHLPVVLLAGGDLGSAIEASRLGAYEYVAQPIDDGFIQSALLGNRNSDHHHGRWG